MDAAQRRALLLASLIIGMVAAPVIGAVLNQTVPTAGNVTLQTNSGLNVTVEGGQDIYEQPFINDKRVAVPGGNVSGQSAGDISLPAGQLNGTWTNTTDIDATSTNITLSPDDKVNLTIISGSDTDSLNYTTMSVADGNPDFVYEGASGNTRVKLTGLPSNTQIRAVDGQQLLDANTTGGSGSLILDMPNSKHVVSLKGNEEPNIKEDTASPTGPQSSSPSQLAVNVSDPNFPDDELNVTAYLNGNKVSSKTVTSAGEVTFSISDPGGGNHSWRVLARDSNGAEDEQTFNFQIPTNVTIFNETAPETKVTTPVNLTFYPVDSDKVVERRTTNGKLSLSGIGLPTDQDIIVELEPDSDYGTRTVLLENLYAQPRLYLLNTSNAAISTVEVRFTISDSTGNFDSSSQIIVRRPLNISNSTNYESITSDQAGANGALFDLEDNERYRIVVKNLDNEKRVIGPYETTQSEEVPLQISVSDVNVSTGSNLWGANATYINKSTGAEIEFRYEDPSNETSAIELKIYERGNQSNVLYDDLIQGPFGNLTVTQLLNANQTDEQWVVSYNITRNNQEYRAQELVAQDKRNQLPGMPGWLQEWAAAATLMLIAGAFTVRDHAIGAIVVGLIAGMLWFVGWLETSTSAAAIVIVVGMAILYKSGRTVGGGI